MVLGDKMEDKTIRVHTEAGAKQTLGIHTDITFEIDEKKNQTKKTDGKNAESDEDDRDEVPIYRGTNEKDPNHYYMNRRNFHEMNDENTGTWIRFLPSASGQWTTERYSENLNPQSMQSIN